jgi:hypothetical protein
MPSTAAIFYSSNPTIGIPFYCSVDGMGNIAIMRILLGA